MTEFRFSNQAFLRGVKPAVLDTLKAHLSQDWESVVVDVDSEDRAPDPKLLLVFCWRDALITVPVTQAFFRDVEPKRVCQVIEDHARFALRRMVADRLPVPTAPDEAP